MTNRKQIISSLIWRFAERIGAQGVKFLVEIVLARLLLPDDYGVVAIVTVLISILNVFVDSGLATALIQKKDADDTDFSSVFWFNILLCITIYFFLYLVSPLIADFYNRPEMTVLLRVLGIEVIISGVKNVQQAYVSKTLQFKKFFFSTLGGTIGAAILGISMAYYGSGVWALVAQHLFNIAVDTIILWMTVKWRPKFKFSFDRLKSLLSFGWKLLVSSLLDVGYKEIRALIIGKLYTSSDLAFYNRGEQFPSLIVTNINASIDSVLLPTMSSKQNNVAEVKGMARRAIRTSTYIMIPLMIGLAMCADSIVRLVLTEKWIPAVFYLRIFCITYMFYPIHTANLNAIKALGRSDLFLKLEIIKKIMGLVALVGTMFISVEAMAYSLLFTSFASQIINSWPNRKLLGYPYLDQIKDILPSLVLGIVMGGVVYSINLLQFGDIYILMIQILVGTIIYIGGSILFHIESFDYLLSIISDIKGRHKALDSSK